MKMNIVQPIRDKEKLEQMKFELKKNGTRDYMLFYVGINTGLRVSDIVKLKVSDVKNANGTMKEYVTIVEKKTSKTKKFPIYNGLLAELTKYTSDMEQDQYLFPSQKGVNQHITEVQAYRILNKAGKNIGLEEIGTHSMRKTFGYHHYQQNKDVALLQEIFNHSAPIITLRYIGINQDIIDSSLRSFAL